MLNTKKSFPLSVILLLVGSLFWVPVVQGAETDWSDLIRVDEKLLLQTINRAMLTRSHNNPKLSTSLNNVISAYNENADTWPSTLDTTGLLIENNEILLEIRYDPNAPAVIGDLVHIYGLRLRHDIEYGFIEAWVPVGILNTISQIDAIYFIRSARLVEHYVGNSTTQGVVQSNADFWHTAGVDGTGVMIAVIDSFNNTSGQIALLQASGDWPVGGSLTMVDVDGGGFGSIGSNHGNATTEIAFDMAPGASFIVYETLTVGDWYSAIDMADTAGVNIISASLGAPLDGVGDGSALPGSIAEAAGNARANDVLSVNAAGNSRQEHWGGIFVGTGVSPGLGYTDSLTWGHGSNVNIGLYCLPDGYPISLDLFWDDWTPPVDHDYDLFLMEWDDTGGSFNVVATSQNRQSGLPGQLPQEWISYTATGTQGGLGCPVGTGVFGALVAEFSTTSDRNLQMFTNFSQQQVFMDASSLGFPADSANVFTVAAIDVTSHDQEVYSSEGPILPPGGGPAPVASPLAGPEKPDAASFANVDTESYGIGVFNGTSAAAPHVAGFAALVKQNNPAFTVDQLEAELISIASTGDNDLGIVGHDNEFGYGRVQFKFTPTAITLTSFSITSQEARFTWYLLPVLIGFLLFVVGLFLLWKKNLRVR